MPAGYDVVMLKPSGVMLSLMGLIECPDLEGARHIAEGSKSKLVSADGEIIKTHIDLNDGTLEGLRHRNLPLFSVQYHPEASPGPHDSHYLFKDFVKMMEEFKN